VLVLFVGIVATSVSAVLIRLAQAEAPSLVIAAWRLMLATLLLLPICLARRRPELRRMAAADWRLALLAGLMLALHFASWISSLAYTTVASSTVLVATVPLWVGLASPFFLGESLSRPLRIGIALAVGGSMIIGIGGVTGGSRPLLGNSLALVGAITGSIYIVIGRQLRPRLSLLSYVTVVYGAGALFLLPAVLGSGYALFGYTPAVFLLFLLMALFPQLLGHSAYNWALAYLPAAFVAVAIVSEPILASLMALLLFQETPGPATLLGGALIFAGILIASRR
jgi:drug/metabolite transporter (DMT)-like permease